MLKYVLMSIALVGFMTKANENNIFTTEHELISRYNSEIKHFWQQGNFSQINGINDIRINYASFINTKVTTPAKCLVIASGRSESYLKYKELSYDLFNLGYSVFLLDHRGQGLSQRLLADSHKGHVENFQYYVDDLSVFIEEVVTPHCHGTKPYLLAHSMGGAIAARYMQDFPEKIQAAVLSSPMLGFNSGSVPEIVAKSVVNISAYLNQWLDKEPWYFLGHKGFTQHAFSENKLMHSSVRYQLFIQLYKDTPEIQLGGVTVKWLTESQAALEKVFNNLDKMTTPLLVLQAGADTIIKNQAQNDFCHQLQKLQPNSCPDGKPFTIADAYHELFFESDVYREKALSAAVQWFTQHP